MGTDQCVCFVLINCDNINKMATGRNKFESTLALGSDSDDTYITEVAEEHLEDLKSMIIDCLSKADKFSAHLVHSKGQPAQLVFTLGEKKDKLKRSLPNKVTNKLLLKNIPSSSDKDHLQMFFEYEKGQGGGPVKQVTVNDDRSAIIEFENAKSVGTVLNKRPIKMLGETVDVTPIVPYLESGETFSTMTVQGIPTGLSADIATLGLKAKIANLSLKRDTKSPRPFQIGDRVKVKRSVKTPKYQWGSVTHQDVGIITQIDADGDVVVDFPDCEGWDGILNEMELA